MNDLFSDVVAPDVALLANGAPPSGDARALMLNARVLVACDGAVDKAHELGRDPDFVVGDGDSVSPRMRASLGDRFVYVGEQETNDLSKAFNFACSEFSTARTLVIVGAHGLREDHLLGNLSRLQDFAEVFARSAERPSDAFVTMVTDSGRFDVVRGRRVFKTCVGKAFSVFDFRGAAKVVSDGLEWPLEGVRLDALWKGTLNRADKDTVAIAADSPVVVFRPL